MSPYLASPGSAGRAGALTQLWVAYVALANAVGHRRLARRGRVVVFDRYVLDSVVRTRYLWGGAFRVQARLLSALSPRPRLAFLLDVPPETALGRKQDQWGLDDLRSQAALYREEAERLGVTRLDGTRPREELCAEIAEALWRAL